MLAKKRERFVVWPPAFFFFLIKLSAFLYPKSSVSIDQKKRKLSPLNHSLRLKTCLSSEGPGPGDLGPWGRGDAALPRPRQETGVFL